MHPTADEIRGELKRKNMRISFFEVEDKRNSKSRTYRVGQFKDKGMTAEEVMAVINEHMDVFDVKITYEDSVVDFTVKDFDGRRSDQEFFEFLISDEFKDEDSVQEHVGKFMQMLIIDFARDIIDKAPSNKHELNDLVKVYSKKYGDIKGMLWNDYEKMVLPDGMTKTKIKRARTMMVNVLEEYMFDRYYRQIILPQVKDTYPHWDL